MPDFVIVDAATGTVLYSATSSSTIEEVRATWPLAGKLAIEIDGPIAPEAWRVVDGILVARQAMAVSLSATEIAADGVATCILSGLPDPCVARISGAFAAGPATIEGGTLTLTSTEPGEIRISLRADPDYAPWTEIIHAV